MFHSRPLIAIPILIAGSFLLSNCGGYGVSDSSRPSFNSSSNSNPFYPAITLKGANPLILEAPAHYSEPGAQATSLLEGDLSSGISIQGSVNGNVLGSYKITYSVSDSAGRSTSVTRIVEVVDTTPPVITLLGSANINITQGNSFQDPGAQAIDSFEGNLSSRITISGSVDTNTPGTYVLTYNVSDSSGNNATPVTRNIVVSGRSPGGPISINHPLSGYVFTPNVNLQGICQPNFTLQVSGDLSSNGFNLVCPNSGSFSISVTLSGGDGSKNVTITQVSATTNPTSASVNLILRSNPIVFNPQVLTINLCDNSTSVYMNGVSAIDANGHSATPSVTGSVNVYRTTNGTLTYSVTDISGYVYSVNRSVTVNGQLNGESFSTGIKQVSDLQLLASNPTGHFLICNDMDLGGNMNPIGASLNNSNFAFSGLLSGGGHTLYDGHLLAGETSLSNFQFQTFSTPTGLIIRLGSNGIIENLILQGIQVDAVNNSGTLVGENSGTIRQVAVLQDPTTSSPMIQLVSGSSPIGGIVGANRSSGQILQSFSTSNIAGLFDVGGLVGVNAGSISDSFSKSNLSVTSNLGPTRGYFGGLVGQNNGTIDRSFAVTPQLSAIGSSVSGLIGNYQSGSSAPMSFWDVDVSGISDQGNDPLIGSGLNTSDFQNASLFQSQDDSWDFTSVWVPASSSQTYPVLRWKPSGF